MATDDDSVLRGAERNPWKRRSRRIAYENAWMTVFDDDVTRPDGQPGAYGVVHFKNRSVGVVAINNAGQVLMVGQFRYSINRYSWEIPAGGAPVGEEPEATARRELKEETGYSAGTMQLLLHAHMSNSITDEEGFCFLARDLHDGISDPEGSEVIQQKWFDFSAVLNDIATGTITDALTIIGLQQAALRLGLAR